MQENPPSPTPDWRTKGVHLYKKYERYTPAAFFLSGFILDLFTLGRIDDWSNWLMQGIYLFAAGGLLLWLFFQPEVPETAASQKWKRLLFEYRTEAMHFCFGALLSVYTIFYFKSSSLIVSFGFILLLTGLLVANELEFFKKKGFFLKFALFALCVFSFFAYFIPILIGQIGTWVFVLSFVVTAAFFAGLFHFFRLRGVENQLLMKDFFRPVSFVLILFLVLYLLRVLPPVPLSLKFIGAYHNVERTDGEYKLTHQREFWRIWNNGDQFFRAAPGDKIFIFFKLFSPSHFTEQVWLDWYFKDPRIGWSLQDRIPIQIRGGREEGFRGYGHKSNYQPGDWRVVVSTSDGREIGRMSLEIENVNSPPEEEWKHDFH